MHYRELFSFLFGFATATSIPDFEKLILEFSQQIEKPKLFPNKIDFSVSL
jgi:hypothetical protein